MANGVPVACHADKLSMATKIDSNQRQDAGDDSKPTEQVRREALVFLRQEAGFAQVFTITRTGYPVGRTMGALINDDWSVDLVQRGIHHRIGQLRHNPRMEIVWAGTPQAGSTNDSPHVYDFGLLVPRAVFLRGDVTFLDSETTISVFRRQTAAVRSRGSGRSPARSDENIRQELVGLHVAPVQIRAEGFGAGAQSYTWTVKE